MRFLVVTSLILSAWTLVVHWLNLPEFVLPGPWEILREIWLNWSVLLHGAIATTWKALIGLIIASALTFFAVTLLGNRITVRCSLLSGAAALEAIPKIVFAPIFTIWLGIGSSPKIMLAVLLCFYPCLQRLDSAWQACPIDLLTFARSLGASDRDIFWRIRLRWMIPDFIEAVKLALPLAFIGVIVGELIAAPNGIGPIMMRALGELNMALVMGAALLISLIVGGLVSLAELLHVHLREFQKYAAS